MSKKSRFLSILLILLLTLPTFTAYPSTWALSNYDLTTDRPILKPETINNAIWEMFQSNAAAGSGTFSSFLRTNSNKSIEKGYNSDLRKVQFDEDNSPQFNRSFLLSNVPLIVYEEKLYREFQLDLNEPGSGPEWYISLDKFQVWLTDVPNITNYDDEEYTFTTDASIVYDLGDNSIKMDYRANTGSGKRDYRVLIPETLFENKDGKYVVLFTEFGRQFANDSGFEEWGVRVFEPTPAIDIEKFTNGEDADTTTGPMIPVGDVVTWTYEVTNIGNVTIENIKVTDDQGVEVTLPKTSLTPGESMIGIATGIATAGQYVNIGKVTGDPTTGKQVTDSDPSHYFGIYLPQIEITKTASPTSVPETGAYVDFTFQVTNTGENKVKITTVVDDKLGTIYEWATGADEIWLEKGESHTFMLNDQLISGNFGNDHINVVTATAYDEYRNFDIAIDQESVTFEDVLPDISLEKTASRTSVLESGEYVDFTFTVTNNGDESVKITSVNDDKLGTIYSWSTGDEEIWLTEGQSHTFTANNKLILGSAGADHINTATAIAYDDDGNYDTASDTATIQITNTPPTTGEIKITKNITAIENADLSNLTFLFKIKLTGISEGASYPNGLTKDFTADDQELTWDNLLPGKYVISEEDPGSRWNVSYSQNEITITAGDSKSATVTNTYNYIPPVLNPQLSLTKTGTFNSGNDDFADPGEFITYVFEIMNIGNVTLTGITLNDPMLGGSITLPLSTLQVGESLTVTAKYAVTQADIDAGKVDNTGTADSIESISDTDKETVTLPQKPVLELIKSGTWVDANEDGKADPGEMINFSFTVTNKGNVTLTNVMVSELVEGITVIGGPISLDVNESDATTFTASYTLKQSDIEKGNVYNNASADSSQTDPVTDDVTVPLVKRAALSIVKNGTWVDSNNNGYANVGEPINYTFTVTNTGNVKLTNVHVTDPKVTVSGNPVVLEVGDDPVVFTGIYTLTENDLKAKEVYNEATAHSDQTTDIKDDHTISLRVYTPSTTTTTTSRTPDPGRIEIFKFLDVDNSKTFNTGDLPFSNILFQLFGEDDKLVGTATTNSQGNAVFSNLDEGTYFIKEVRGDYTITTPTLNADGMIEVEVVQDETTEVSIGNYREVIPPQEPPLGPPPVIEEVIEDKVPQGPPALPKTGEIPPYFAYGFGSLLVLAGLFMKRKF